MAIKLAGCVLLDKTNKIGLLHRNKGGISQWELPGGKVELRETEFHAAQRELREELGIDVALVREIGQAPFSDNNKEYVYMWFLATIISGVPHVCEPQTFDDFTYCSLGQLENLKLSTNMRVLVGQLKNNKVTLE